MLRNTDKQYSDWEYSTTIFVPFGDLKKLIAWCEKNCQDDWTFVSTVEAYEPRQIHAMGSDYYFMFEDDRDLTLFILRWK